MQKKCYGVYEHLSDAYRAMLHLIGSGYTCRDILIITPKLSCNMANDRQRCHHENHQKHILARTQCLHLYTPEYIAALPPTERAFLEPFIAKLDAGYSVIFLRK